LQAADSHDHSPGGSPPDPSPPRGRNLPIAILTGLTLAGLLLGTLFSTKIGFFILAFSVILFAQHEFYEALSAKGGRPAAPLGLAGGAVVLIGAFTRGTEAMTFGVVLVIVGSFLWFLADADRSNVTANAAATVLGLVYVPVLGAHVVLMRSLNHGPAIVVSFIGLVALYDIGAYASGSLFGKHKIAPEISPSKTWEGAAGATVFILIVAAAAGPFIGPFTVLPALALAAAMAITAPMGDLAESLLKRDLGVKDFGRILPGHGGFLDRIDALLLSAPVAYWLVRGIL
jgi:phosphatidate cytidylyltransferase